MKEALAEAGLDLYKGKIMSQADANKTRQADQLTAQAARADAAKSKPAVVSKTPSTETKSKLAPSTPKKNTGISPRR